MTESSQLVADPQDVLPDDVEAAVQHLFKLPAEQRLAVSRCLEASAEIEAKWARVAARRAAELRSGQVQGVSIDKAFEQARRAIDAIRPNAS